MVKVSPTWIPGPESWVTETESVGAIAVPFEPMKRRSTVAPAEAGRGAAPRPRRAIAKWTAATLRIDARASLGRGRRAGLAGTAPPGVAARPDSPPTVGASRRRRVSWERKRRGLRTGRPSEPQEQLTGGGGRERGPLGRGEARAVRLGIGRWCRPARRGA